MVLSGLDILHSIFTLVTVLISIIIGLIITSKYFKVKQTNVLLIGLFWTGLTFPWLPTVITFIIHYSTPSELLSLILFVRSEVHHESELLRNDR